MPSLSGADKVADRLATLEGKLDTLCLLFIHPRAPKLD